MWRCMLTWVGASASTFAWSRPGCRKNLMVRRMKKEAFEMRKASKRQPIIDAPSVDKRERCGIRQMFISMISIWRSFEHEWQLSKTSRTKGQEALCKHCLLVCARYENDFFFFFLHCRASTGHGRSTHEKCDCKKGETGIKCRSLFTGWKAEKPRNKTRTTQQKPPTTQKEPVKILAKVVKPTRPP